MNHESRTLRRRKDTNCFLAVRHFRCRHALRPTYIHTARVIAVMNPVTSSYSGKDRRLIPQSILHLLLEHSPYDVTVQLPASLFRDSIKRRAQCLLSLRVARLGNSLPDRLSTNRFACDSTRDNMANMKTVRISRSGPRSAPCPR